MLALVYNRAARKSPTLLLPAISLPGGGLTTSLHGIGTSLFERLQSHRPALSKASRRREGAVFAPRSFQLSDIAVRAETSIVAWNDDRLEVLRSSVPGRLAVFYANGGAV